MKSFGKLSFCWLRTYISTKILSTWQVEAGCDCQTFRFSSSHPCTMAFLFTPRIAVKRIHAHFGFCKRATAILSVMMHSFRQYYHSGMSCETCFHGNLRSYLLNSCLLWLVTLRPRKKSLPR